MEKIKCDDQKLEEVIRNIVSKWEGFTSITELLSSYENELKSLFCKDLDINSPIELTKEDQLRINKILCKMITSGQLIINLVGQRCYSGGIEVAWSGKTQ